MNKIQISKIKTDKAKEKYTEIINQKLSQFAFGKYIEDQQSFFGNINFSGKTIQPSSNFNQFAIKDVQEQGLHRIYRVINNKEIVFYLDNFYVLDVCMEQHICMLVHLNFKVLKLTNKNLSKESISIIKYIEQEFNESTATSEKLVKHLIDKQELPEENVQNYHEIVGNFRNLVDPIYSKNDPKNNSYSTIIIVNPKINSSTRESLDYLENTFGKLQYHTLHLITKKYYDYRESFNNGFDEEELDEDLFDDNYDTYLDKFEGQRYIISHRITSISFDFVNNIVNSSITKSFAHILTNYSFYNSIKGSLFELNIPNSNYGRFIIDDYIGHKNSLGNFMLFAVGILFVNEDIHKINNESEFLKYSNGLFSNLSVKIETNNYNSNTIGIVEQDNIILFPLNEPVGSLKCIMFIFPITNRFFRLEGVNIFNVVKEISTNVKTSIDSYVESAKIFGNKSIKKKMFEEQSLSKSIFSIVDAENITCKKDNIKRDTIILKSINNPNLQSRFLLSEVNLIEKDYKLFSFSNKKELSALIWVDNIYFSKMKNLSLSFFSRKKIISKNDIVVFKKSCKILPKSFSKEEKLTVLEVEIKEKTKGIFSGKTMVTVLNKEKQLITKVPINMVKLTKKFKDNDIK